MKYTYHINGVSCEGCVEKVSQVFSEIPYLKYSINLDTKEVVLDSIVPINMEEINSKLSEVGNYQLIKPEEAPKNSTRPQDSISPSSVYYCPMECEGDKVYFTQGQRCPVCKMYLVPIEEKLAQDPNYKPQYSLQQLPENFQYQMGHYFCPMFCEGDKVYDSMAGCPVCGMDLEPITKDLLSKASFIETPTPTHPTHETPIVTDEMAGKYYCPMYCEGDKVYDSNVGCPICGMDLVQYPEKEVVVYQCPDHPEMTSPNPGKCSVCEKDLVRTKTPSHAAQSTETVLKQKFVIALIFCIPLFILSMGGMWINFNINPVLKGWIECLLTLPILFYSGWFLMKRGWRSFQTWNLNMFSLIALGVAAAFIFSLVALVYPDILPQAMLSGHHGNTRPLYFEAVGVILTLVILGQLMEALAHKKTGKAIEELMQLMPAEATVIREGEEVKVLIEDVKVGDLIKVKPGEKIPVDGILTEGQTTVNESMVTGESLPVRKNKNESVIGGTLNGQQPFIMKAEKIGKDTVVSQIIKLVTDASRSKAPIQNVTDKVAKIFVPTVITISILTFIAWIIFGTDHNRWAYGFANAIAVLIVACPCALGLATPMSLMVGIGKGAKNGILIKNATALENLNKINVLVTDKTGTLTQGKPSVEVVKTFSPRNENEILQLAYSLSKDSEHPLASAVVQYAQNLGLKILNTESFKNNTGKGVVAKINGLSVALGNIELITDLGIKMGTSVLKEAEILQETGHTISYIAENTEIIGFIGFKDVIKPQIKETIKYLSKRNIRVVMLSGDNEKTVKAIAQEIGIEDYKAQCLPEHKLDYIKELQSKGDRVAMAGDGINDAPALALANVGIAMGTGTSVAIENADLTLIKGEFKDISKAIKLSQSLTKNIHENLFFAFVYNVIGIPVAAGILYPSFGILMSPMIAAAAMSCSSLSVILNSLRLNSAKL